MTSSRMSRRLAPTAALAAAATLLFSLAGCSVSVNLTASADQVATAAADALEASVGVRPIMDCGTESIDLVDGATVDCILTDPNTESRFEAPVTLEYSGSGSEFGVSVQVAEQPLP